MHRFYAPDLDPRRLVTLPPDEARHLASVLRLREGDQVAVFDGRGGEVVGVVAEIARRAVRIRPLAPREPTRESSVRVTLAAALLKGNAVDNLVRDATMLGAAVLQPFRSARTIASMAGARASHQVNRWRRIAIASCKQCGRAVVPEVRPPADFTAFLTNDQSALRLLLVEPSAAAAAMPASSLMGHPPPRSATLAVGPEGGWTPDELRQAQAQGFQLLCVGARTLRAETVPLVAMAVLQFVWGDL